MEEKAFSVKEKYNLLFRREKIIFLRMKIIQF